MATIEQAKLMAKSLPDHEVAAFIGDPGCGKSEAQHQLALELGTPPDRIEDIHVNSFDVVDLGGVPSIKKIDDVDMTVFNPTRMLYRFRKGTGRGFINLEEVPQANNHMMTWLAGFILTRATNEFELDPQVRIGITGNKVENKAGAKRMLSHLEDRCWFIDIDACIDAWSAHALDVEKCDPMGVAFLRLRKALLSDFDPANRSNATPRSWSKVFRFADTSLPTELYYELVKGKVGEGAASEWCAAREIMADCPSPDVVRQHPTTTEIPSEEQAPISFAIVTALSSSTDENLFPIDMQYVERMKPEFQMLYVQDSIRRFPQVEQTKTFIDWAIKNQDLLLGGK